MSSFAIQDLRALADPQKSALLPRFFKTGEGQYGEGDVFIGVTVPHIRSVAKKHRDLPLRDIPKLLADPIHEVRLMALLILVSQYERGDEPLKKRIVEFYLSHKKHINNWDLVDASCYKILGDWLVRHCDPSILKTLAQSDDLWTQRIAIVSTFAFIRAGDTQPTMDIATILLHHSHDLIHKATGWMLREAGKKDEACLRKFLNIHAATMPRTMLRYAVEKLTPDDRNHFMGKKASAAHTKRET